MGQNDCSCIYGCWSLANTQFACGRIAEQFTLNPATRDWEIRLQARFSRWFKTATCLIPTFAIKNKTRKSRTKLPESSTMKLCGLVRVIVPNCCLYFLQSRFSHLYQTIHTNFKTSIIHFYQLWPSLLTMFHQSWRHLELFVHGLRFRRYFRPLHDGILDNSLDRSTWTCVQAYVFILWCAVIGAICAHRRPSHE